MIARVLGSRSAPTLVWSRSATIGLPHGGRQPILRAPPCSTSGIGRRSRSAGAVHLAHNDAFDAQAFRYDGHVYGVEFHPEMTLAMVERWTASEKGEPMLTLPGAQPREVQLEGYRRYAALSVAGSAASSTSAC